MNKLRYLSLAIFIAFSLPTGPGAAAGEVWIYLQKLDDGKTLYYDTESIRYSSEEIATVSVKKVTKDNVDYSFTIWEMGCSERLFRKVMSYRYYEKGQLIPYELYSKRWKDIPPDTHTEKLYKVVCSKDD